MTSNAILRSQYFKCPLFVKAMRYNYMKNIAKKKLSHSMGSNALTGITYLE